MRLLLLLVLVCNFAYSAPLQDHRVNPKALSELLSALNMNPHGDVIAQTQKQWLRKPGQERWEQSELSQDQRKFVLDWAEAQGLFAPWEPSCKNYDKALILGATTSRMQMRLDYLKKLWIQGLRFQEIVWLTGERPLDKRVD